jgi:predicted amidophosphoribosyltransferase
MNAMLKPVVALGDLLMPRICPVCGRALGVEERYICLSCEADLPLTFYWERTHNPMADRLNAALLDQEGMPYAYAAALMFYDDDASYKMIPRRLKYENGLGTGRYFAVLLGRYLAGSEHFSDVDTVIPVPLHWLRRWKRGYNQAAVIARAVAKELGAQCREDILYRRRRTSTQTRLGGEERARNVAGAFGVRERFRIKSGMTCTPSGMTCTPSGMTCTPAGMTSAPSAAEAPGPRHVLLLDDVFTTGATTAACFRALRAVLPGNVRISVATLAFVEQ